MKRYRIIVLFAVLLLGGQVLSQGSTGWNVAIYNNTRFAGAPDATYSTPTLNLNWGLGSPAAGIDPNNFTARITNFVYFTAGTYRFSVVADDEFALRIDGVEYLNTLPGTGEPGKLFTVDVPLTTAYHRIEVDYREYVDQAYIRLDWELVKNQPVVNPPPYVGPTPVPALPATPIPPPPPADLDAEQVTTRYGNYTPCIEQDIHQINCFDPTGYWAAPNAGSIRIEPQIVLWQQCDPDNEVRRVLRAGQGPTDAKCSKTGAGYFPV